MRSLGEALVERSQAMRHVVTEGGRMVSHVAFRDQFWIGEITRLSISLVQECDGQWNLELFTEHRSESGGTQADACIVFRVEHLRDFSDAIAKALKGAVARDIGAA